MRAAQQNVYRLNAIFVFDAIAERNVIQQAITLHESLRLGKVALLILLHNPVAQHRRSCNIKHQNKREINRHKYRNKYKHRSSGNNQAKTKLGCSSNGLPALISRFR